MAVIKRFEDLGVWKEARTFTAMIYELTGSSSFRDPGLKSQIREAAVSTMNNSAEGFDSGSRPEFSRFLRYVIRSASEAQSCLYVALDQEYVDEHGFERAYCQGNSVKNCAGGMIRHLKGKARRC